MMSHSGLSRLDHTKPFVFCLIITVPELAFIILPLSAINKNPSLQSWHSQENAEAGTERLHVGLFRLPEVAFALRFLPVRCRFLHCGFRFLRYFSHYGPSVHSRLITSILVAIAYGALFKLSAFILTICHTLTHLIPNKSHYFHFSR